MHDSREVQAAVRARLDERGLQLWGGRSPAHGAYTAKEIVDTLVWETLAVLGEWELIELEAQNSAAVTLLSPTEREAE